MEPEKTEPETTPASASSSSGEASAAPTTATIASAPLTVPTPVHRFWSTQPVPQALSEVADSNREIEGPKAEVRKEPYGLPEGFKWVTCNIDDQVEINDVYSLLNENYVEDEDNMFRFDYSKEFLHWALKPPGFRHDWHVGIRTTSGKLMAFISAIPALIRVYEKSVQMVEINFLCVHKKLRSKRLAPVLIKEITRRVNLQNIWQATYTAGVSLPTPVTSCRYYHRSLNPKKLIDVGFSYLAPRMTMARTIKLYKLPEEPQIPGLRPLEKRDVVSAQSLVSKYLEKFKLVPTFTVDEFAHWFLPRDNVIYTYVVQDAASKQITDLVSFYNLPSTIIGNKQYTNLKAAYSFYNVATSVPLTKLMNDGLIMAKKHDFDVYNCLNLQENDEFIKELKFGPGDGNLHYYLYNWTCPSMEHNEMGLVLL